MAAQEGRILVTSDLKTMPGHFAGFIRDHGHCPGVFLVKQSTPLADVIEDLILVWAASEAAEWRNRIVEIPQA